MKNILMLFITMICAVACYNEGKPDKKNPSIIVIDENRITEMVARKHHYLLIDPIGEYNTTLIHDPDCPYCRDSLLMLQNKHNEYDRR